jgi:hypothetical protein
MSAETTWVVSRFATGFQRTTVTRLPDGTHRWVREAGEDRPGPLSAPGPRERHALAALAPGPVALSLPRPVGGRPDAPGALHYRVPGAVSAAQLLGYDLDADGRVRVAAALRGTGALLRGVHTGVRPGDVPPGRPVAVDRLESWLRHGAGPRAAQLLHQRARRVLGEHRLERLRHWCGCLAGGPGAPWVALHGAPSTGGLVLSSQPGGDALFGGEDLARGPAEFDLGWLLGELLEQRILAAAQGSARPWLAGLAEELLAGYGAPADTATTGRAAVLRIATHLHDFAAYVGWHHELHLLAGRLAEHVDSEGRHAAQS